VWSAASGVILYIRFFRTEKVKWSTELFIAHVAERDIMERCYQRGLNIAGGSIGKVD